MNKALFLDRDGIINIDHGYVFQSEQFEFIEEIFEVCLHAINLGYLIIVITNQSGIARGKYSEQDFNQLTLWMKNEFARRQIKIDDVYFCPHHPSKGTAEYLKKCLCRKPEPGMILTAAIDHQLNLKESIFIGDKLSDMQAAQAAGIENRILLSSRYNAQMNEDDSQINFHSIEKVSDASLFID